MPTKPIQLDYQDLKEYFLNKRRRMYYDAAVKKRSDFLPHSDGAYPQEVIEMQRPNESDQVKEFRKKIWQPITTPKFTQITSSLGKIRRSSDWSVKHDVEDENISRITDGESLEDYCEVHYPFFGSLTNWVFSALMKPYLIDPNSVILVLPLDADVDANEYLKPFPYIFDSCDVYEFIPEKLAILRDPEGSSIYRDGLCFYVITTLAVEKWEQATAKIFNRTMIYNHGLDLMPAFMLGGVISKSHGYNFLFESRISGILPNLNEAVAEYTDLQAGKRLHVYPERWEYSQHECGPCKGTGQMMNTNWRSDSPSDVPRQLNCTHCGGVGVVSGPYSKLIVKPTQAGMQPLPNPPAGFVEKDVEIIKIMDESWRRHIFDALASINFQFLDQSPLNQSGVAKEVDKEELNNTVHAIAEDIVKIMDLIYKITARYRYKGLYSFEAIDEMLPSVAVPDHFDLLSSQFMQEEISKAKTSKINGVIVSAMEIEFAGKRFINEPEVKDRTELVLKLDPLPNKTEDEKMSMLSNKGITLMNYIISSNIESFVQRAIDEDIKFAAKPLPEQIKIMQEYAQEQIDEQKKQAEEAMAAAQENMAAQGGADPEGGINDAGVEEDEPIEEPMVF